MAEQKPYHTFALVFGGWITVHEDKAPMRKYVEVKFNITEVGIEEASRLGRKTLKSFTTEDAAELVLLSVTKTP